MKGKNLTQGQWDRINHCIFVAIEAFQKDIDMFKVQVAKAEQRGEHVSVVTSLKRTIEEFERYKAEAQEIADILL